MKKESTCRDWGTGFEIDENFLNCQLGEQTVKPVKMIILVRSFNKHKQVELSPKVLHDLVVTGRVLRFEKFTGVLGSLFVVFHKLNRSNLNSFAEQQRKLSLGL